VYACMFRVGREKRENSEAASFRRIYLSDDIDSIRSPDSNSVIGWDEI
jgi:hypothetical protein